MSSLRLEAPPGFSLAASMAFLEGFAPAVQAPSPPGHLHLAFCAEGSWAPTAVCLRQEGPLLLGQVVGGEAGEAGKNVNRILSLDNDGTGFAAVAGRDPVVAGLQARYPGLRPVGFFSPYEAAVWAVLSQRVRIVQAAAVKARITTAIGHRLRLCDTTVLAFPAPGRLAEAAADLGLPDRKAGWLRSVAEAAQRAELDASRLRSQDPSAALENLQRLAGIGPFSAELILVRGAMAPDVFPSAERRLHDSMRAAYGQPAATLGELAAIAERWRPYRSWVALLLRAAREEDTHEISDGPR